MRLFSVALLCICLPLSASATTKVEAAQERLDLYIGDAVKLSLPDTIKTAFISHPEIANYQVVSASELLVFGLFPGQATLFVLNTDGETIYSAELHVIPDLRKISAWLTETYPSLDLAVTSAANGRIIVNGLVPDAATAADVISLVDSLLPRSAADRDASADAAQQAGDESSGVGVATGIAGGSFGRIINRLQIENGTQVTVKVRVAEISRKLTERLGLQWQFGREEFAFATSPLFVAPRDAAAAGALFPSLDLAALIDVLAEENLVTVLAEPNLSVLSGETASFLAGGEVLIPELSGSGANVSIGTREKAFGVLLDVTPTVLANDHISLRIRPEVSEPSLALGIQIGGISVPGFNIRRADTTIELASGQSFALAGLLKSNISDTVSKIPGLGDVPLLGVLARSSQFERGDTELVIVATAFISRPTDKALALPTDKIKITGPFARFFSSDVFLPKQALPQDDFMY